MIDHTAEKADANEVESEKNFVNKAINAAINKAGKSKVQEIEHSLHNGIVKKSENSDKKYGLTNYILFFFTFSIGGWIWEVAQHFVRYGELVNRGTLWGPWLPIYGSGGVLVLLLLRKAFKNPVHTFFLTMILTSVLEYMTSLYLEIQTGERWWDYSGYFMNLNGRICLESAVIFGIGGCMIVYVAVPKLDIVYGKVPSRVKTIVCGVLLCLFLVDQIYSAKCPNMGEGVTVEHKVASNALHPSCKADMLLNIEKDYVYLLGAAE